MLASIAYVALTRRGYFAAERSLQVYAIDEKMNPEAMGAFERCFALGELAKMEKIFTVSFSWLILLIVLNGQLTFKSIVRLSCCR